MKTIELTQGMVTVVDDDVYEWASKFKWHVINIGRRFYAVRTYKDRGRWGFKYYLHREIMQPGEGLDVDHKNGDGLDNRRENLRAATRRQNLRAFQRKKPNASSVFRGVSRHKRDKVWNAFITVDGKSIGLGAFKCESDAAKSYDIAAKKCFGEHAQLNFTEHA